MIRGALIYFGLDQNTKKDTFVLSTVAVMVVLLLLIGIGVTIFIIPAYAPEPARLTPPEPPSLTGVWRSNDGETIICVTLEMRFGGLA